jgi:hypothetical protein
MIAGTNTQALPEPASRRAVLGAVLAAGALAAAPSRAFAATEGAEPKLQSLIAAWHEAERRLEEAADAYWAAEERARCSVPRRLSQPIATPVSGATVCPADSIKRAM